MIVLISLTFFFFIIGIVVALFYGNLIEASRNNQIKTEDKELPFPQFSNVEQGPDSMFSSSFGERENKYEKNY